MPAPDVRVRLSVEGDAQVLAALQKVAAGAQKASAATIKAAGEGEKGFGRFRSSLSGLNNLMGQLGIAVTAASLIGLARRAVESAAGIEKMRQRLGGTLENLSALAVGAQLTDSSLEKLEAGLSTLARRVAELRSGNAAAIESFARLGLSARSFRGLDLTQQLELVAHAMQNLKRDGTDAAAAAYFLGKSVGVELLPMMRQLGQVGLSGMKEQAKAMGLLLDARMIQQARALNDSMKIMNLQMLGAATQFMTGFGPAAVQTMDDFAKSTRSAQTGWEALGTAAGGVLRFIYGLLKIVGALLAGIAAMVHVEITGAIDLASKLLRLRFGEALRSVGTTAKQMKTVVGDVWRDMAAGGASMFAKPRALPAVDSSGRGGAEIAEEAFARRNEALKSALDSELKLVQANAKAKEAAEKRHYEQALFSARESFAERRRLAKELSDAEITALMKRRALEFSNPDAVERQKNLLALEAEIAAKRIEGKQAELDLTYQELQAVRQLADTRLDYQMKLLQAQGKNREAAILALDQEERKMRDTLRLSDIPAPVADAQIAIWRRGRERQIDAEENLRSARLELDRLNAEKAKIESDLSLSSEEKARRTLALERERLDVLEQLIAALRASAAATSDPELQRQLENQADALEAIKGHAETGGRGLGQLKDRVSGDVKNALVDFFSTGIQQARNFEEAVLSMASSVVAALQRIAAEQLAEMIWAGLPFKRGGSVPKKASGGLLRGPGSGTSDSIFARLSAGEYVVRAAAVARPGMLEHLEAINFGAIRTMRISPIVVPPGFAEGGMATRSAGQGSSLFGGTLTLDLPAGVSVRDVDAYLDSPDGARKIIRVLSKHRRAVNQATGR